MTTIQGANANQGPRLLMGVLKPITDPAQLAKVRRFPTVIPEPEVPKEPSPSQSALIKVQMATSVSIYTSKGRIDVSNAGYVGSDFDIRGADDGWWFDGLDDVSGPTRASAIAERLQDHFGGTIRTSASAVSQDTYDALVKGSASEQWATSDILGVRGQR